MAKTRLSPWTQGQNDVLDEYDPIYTPSEGRAAPLRSAVNVDLDIRGAATLRDGTTESIVGTAYKSGFAMDSFCLLQDGGTLYKTTDMVNRTELVTGLNASNTIRYLSYGGEVLWTNGEVCRRVTSAGVASNWGLAVPATPSLGTTTGSLESGKYRVALTQVDSAGGESGAYKGSTVTVTGSQAITVSLTSSGSDAVAFNVYCGRTDQSELFFVKQVDIAESTTTITDVLVSDRILRTRHMIPPPAGDVLFSFGGYVLIGTGQFLYVSMGQTPDLFYPASDVLAFSEDVQAGGEVSDGFYVATSGGLYWITGSTPDEWGTETKVERGAFAKGSIALPGSAVPEMDTSKQVLLFAAPKTGLVGAGPGGFVKRLSWGKLNLDTSFTEVRFSYRNMGSRDTPQIIMLTS